MSLYLSGIYCLASTTPVQDWGPRQEVAPIRARAMSSKIDFLMLVFLWFNLVISQLELDELIEIDS